MSLADKIKKQIEILQPLFVDAFNKKVIMDKISEKSRTKKLEEYLKELMNDDSSHMELYQKEREKWYDSYKQELEDWNKSIDKIWNIIFPAWKELIEGKKDNLHVIFAYLKMKERFFRSGYIKSKIVKLLKKLNLDTEEREELGNVIIEVIPHAGQEFNEIVKLAPFVKDIKFEDKVKNIKDDNNYVTRRKNEILFILNKSK